jgi:MFS family permease
MSVVATLSFNWQVLLPLLAEHEFHGDENTYALITTVFSIGSLVGSLLIARRVTMDNRLLARASVGLGISSFLVALAPTVATAALAGALAGATGIAFLSATMTALQLQSIPVMRGRVMALYSILFLGSTPIGGPLAGWIAQVFGTRWSITLGAAAALASGLAGLAVLRRRENVAPSVEPAPVVLEAAA